MEILNFRTSRQVAVMGAQVYINYEMGFLGGWDFNYVSRKHAITPLSLDILNLNPKLEDKPLACKRTGLSDAEASAERQSLAKRAKG